MAGTMRKVGEYLGFVEQADFDDEPEFPAAVGRQSSPATPQVAEQPARVAPVRAVTDLAERRVPEPANGSDLSRIETVAPRTYNDARTVGEHFRAGVPVIMNLSDIGDEDAKRLVDFAAGLVFAVRGTIHRITAKVFLLSPETISVSEADKQAIVAGGFYNQS